MSTPKVTITVRSDGGSTSVLDVKGEINAFAEAPLSEAHAQATAAGARNILLNFNGLEYMNSSGIGLLVTLLIRARRQNQKLLACGLSEHYRQIFELTRLNEAIAIYPTESEALAATRR